MDIKRLSEDNSSYIKPIKKISKAFKDKYKEDKQLKTLIKKLMQGNKVDITI